MDRSAPLVSIVIPSYKRAALVEGCVRSLLAGTYQKLEIIVVDDAYPEPLEKELKSKLCDPRIFFLRNSENKLTAGSRNRGLYAATGEFVLFLDDDNRAAPDMVEKLVACFTRNSDSDTEMQPLGLVAPLSIQMRPEGELIWSLGCFYNFRTSRVRSLHEGDRVSAVQPQGEYPTQYAQNAFMVRRSDALQIHGFEEKYGIMYEEADFGLRIMQLGRCGVICSAARTHHFAAVESNQVPELRHLQIGTPKRAFCFARNRSLFMKRFALRKNLPLFFFFYLPLFTVYYTWKAVRHRRSRIALAFLRGSIVGIFLSLPRVPE